MIAHMGHDLVTFAFYVPPIAFMGWLAVTQFRQRRGGRAEEAETTPEG
jgi:hypothetical protein